MALSDLKDIIKETPPSAIIGHYVPLVQKGAHQVALCPFHQDSNPSLTVNDSKGLFMCFVCQTGGDAITFVQKYKNIDFVEALKEISEALSLDFASFEDKKDESPKRALGQKVLDAASLLYQKYAHGPGLRTFEGFIQKRGLNDDTAKKYQIGLAPKHNILLPYLNSLSGEEQRKSALSMAMELGLIKEKEGRPYDSFRNRIMFPIWSASGKTVAFSGRLAADDAFGPKYYNSPESFMFSKKNTLFGLHLAKNSIREKQELLLVEGHMDQIALTHKGIQNSLAIMGVGLTSSTASRIKKLSSKAILALDSDNAGKAAMSRINGELMGQGVFPLYLDFSPHKDPDDFLQAEGPLALESKIKEAGPWIDHELESLVPSPLPKLTDRKLEIFRTGLQKLVPAGNCPEASERSIHFARRLGLESLPDQIHKWFEEEIQKKDRRPTLRPKTKDKPLTASEEYQNKEDPRDHEGPLPSARPAPMLHDSDKSIIKAVILHPDLLTHPKIDDLLDVITLFEVKAFLLELKKIIHDLDDEGLIQTIMQLQQSSEYPLELKEFIGSALFQFRPIPVSSESLDKLFSDLGIQLQKLSLRQERSELRKKQASCFNVEEGLEILKKIQFIDRKIKALGPQSKPATA